MLTPSDFKSISPNSTVAEFTGDKIDNVNKIRRNRIIVILFFIGTSFNKYFFNMEKKFTFSNKNKKFNNI
jgi:hypothetical protein